jgi:hypothetical protein
MSAVGIGVQKFSGGRVIERTVGTIKRNFKDFALLALILLGLPSLLLQWANLSFGGAANLVLARGGAMFFGGILTGVCSLLAYAAIVRGAVADLNGRRTPVPELLSGAVQSILPLLAVAICWFIAVVIGTALLVVPGLILMTMWAVLIPVQVVEKPAGLGAFARSGALTRGNRWAIFGLGLLYFVVVMVISGTVTATLAASVGASFITSRLGAPGAALGPELYLGLALSAAVSSLLSMVGAVFGAALYFELRSAKEGLAPRDLASVFE